MLDMIESQVFTQVKARMPTKIKNKYPDLDFTTSAKNRTSSGFPCVYIHMLESSENGATTEGDNTEAVYAAFQVEVSDNISPSRAMEIAREVLKIMKALHFQAVVMPISADTDAEYRNVARYRRMLGSDDLL